MDNFDTHRCLVIRSKSAYPRDAPFWRTSGVSENQRFSIVVTTDLLVGNIPDPARASVLRLRRCDIGSMYLLATQREKRTLMRNFNVESDTMQSPCQFDIPQ